MKQEVPKVRNKKRQRHGQNQLRSKKEKVRHYRTKLIENCESLGIEKDIEKA